MAGEGWRGKDRTEEARHGRRGTARMGRDRSEQDWQAWKGKDGIDKARQAKFKQEGKNEQQDQKH